MNQFGALRDIPNRAAGAALQVDEKLI